MDVNHSKTHLTHMISRVHDKAVVATALWTDRQHVDIIR